MKPSDGSFDPTLTPEQVVETGDTAVSVDGSRPAGRSSTPSLRDYKVGELLGRGGMGEVLLAKDVRIGRDVAIKRMRGESPSDGARARFLREAKIQARLDHPAIVPVHELGHDADGYPYFTMKRLAGTTLLEVMEGTTASQQRLLRAFVDVCLALDFAHTRGFIHRDLKPANVVLGDYGEVYVLDWGLARALDDPDEPSTNDAESLGGETQVGTVMGTPGYMSPEQLRGEPVGPATDVYALGAIFYEILVGRTVHPEGHPAVAATLAGGVLSPAKHAPERNIAPELDQLCTRALGESAAGRPTARQLADGVQQFLDGDRDHERRRQLAADLVISARADLDSGDPERRANAMRAAGRALALDPASEGAATLVSKLMLEPPPVMPPALVAKLADSDLEQVGVHATLATRTVSLFFLFAPIVLWLGVREWSVFFAVLALTTASICSSIIMWRRRTFSILIPLALNGALMVVISRLISPLLMIPGLIAGSCVSFATFPRLLTRPWIPIGTFVATLVIPLVLEATGVWTSSWEIANGFVAHPSAVDFHGAAANVFLITGNLAIIIGLPLFVRSIAMAQRSSRRQLEIQAWHLGQLIPETRAARN